MHWACAPNFQVSKRVEMVEFLVRREMIERKEGRWEVPTYNMVDDFGCTPVFRTRSSRVVEFLLELHDIAVIDEDGNPLLYECIRRGMITDAIANNDKMKAQFGLRHQGSLPMALLFKGGEIL